MKRGLGLGVDLGVGERLALGFGTAGLLMALLAVLAHVWTGRIGQIRETYNQIVAPRAAAADRLETDVLYLGIAARNHALVPDARHLQEYESALRRVRDEVKRLGELPRDPGGLEGSGGDQGLARLAELADRYEFATRTMVESARNGTALDALEPGLGAAREELLAVISAYAARQHDRLDQLRTEVTRSVAATDRAVSWVGALLLAVLVFTAWATTRSVRRPALALAASARRVGAGDFERAIELAGGAHDPEIGARRDELAEVARAFGRMALDLRGREERLRAGAVLAAALARTPDVGRICAAALEVILSHLGAECGAIYRADEDGMLRLAHGVGLAGGDEAFAPGHGLPGRAAEARKAVVVSELPADAPFTLRLGVDRVPPRAVVAVPMVLQEPFVAGVLVVAAARPIPPDQVAFLQRAADMLGVSLQNARARERIERLARELQERNERLQAQQEELQSQNEELQAQREELQSQNEELQAQGEELRRAEEGLRQADRNKNDFLAVLSHELRNPLAPIHNSLHVLERAAPGSEQAGRAHAVVSRQVRQLTRLVEDLLDVTRISNGKVRLRRAPVDLSRLVRQMGEDVAADFAGRGLTLEVEAAGAVRVDGDPARLSQIVGNLLQNAAKFTPRGGAVRVALEAAGGRARLRVRDSGAGMDGETLGRLFQPFMQADATLARTDGGLGLGLALVKALSEAHGGTVRAESEGRGKGAEFVVELPLHLDEGVSAPAQSAADSARPARRRRVLVIEDNVDAADTLRDVLALAGHEVEVAYRGADGVARARGFGPEVVLCDIGLPDMNGHEVARALRADPALRAALLVALTGYALPDDERRAREAGFDAHLPKPPSMDRLGVLLSTLGEQAREAG